MSEEGNKYFKGGEPTWANACVGENGNPSYTEYYKGYSKAANVLLDAVISDKGVRLWLDDFIYPICFNFRHSIEFILVKSLPLKIHLLALTILDLTT